MLGIYLLGIKGHIEPFDLKILESLNSDLISVSISLAGFVLASLTIIVTFKDSINVRVEKKRSEVNGQNLFFQSKHYFPTVRIFYRASLILLLVFFILSISKLLNEKINEYIFQNLVITCLLLIVLTVLRSLYLLLQIIKLQTQSDKNLNDENWKLFDYDLKQRLKVVRGIKEKKLSRLRQYFYVDQSDL